MGAAEWLKWLGAGSTALAFVRYGWLRLRHPETMTATRRLWRLALRWGLAPIERDALIEATGIDSTTEGAMTEALKRVAHWRARDPGATDSQPGGSGSAATPPMSPTPSLPHSNPRTRPALKRP